MEMSKCIGGLSSSKWGGQYHQQDRVYQMGDIALAMTASIPGGSYLYLEVEKVTDELIQVGQMPGFECENRVYSPEGICPSLKIGGDPKKIIEVAAMRGRENGQQLEINKEGISNTVTTVAKDNMILEEYVHVNQATKEGSIPCKIGGVADLNYPTSQTRRGRVQGNGEICPTLTTENIPSVIESWIWEVDGVKYRIRIRKLTPRECFRLMDFDDEDFDKAAQVNSNTQLYKEAGNSIVVSVLENIFKQLIPEDRRNEVIK